MIDTGRYLKIPFKSHGRDFTGCDCYGLIRLILKEEYGKDIPDFWDYTHAHDVAAVSELILKNKPAVVSRKIETPIDGCVVTFKHSGKVCHVGLYVGDGRVIHMLNGANVACSKLKMIEKIYKVEGFYEI